VNEIIFLKDGEYRDTGIPAKAAMYLVSKFAHARILFIYNVLPNKLCIFATASRVFVLPLIGIFSQGTFGGFFI
jgi:hypothetical protein